MNHRIVHLSDIHYGPPFQYALEPILLKGIKDLTPDLVVLSGDLTQRAKKRQFQQAKAFLDRLPKPYLVIPGNHDVPLYNVFDRLFRSLERYKTYIRADVDMVVETDGIQAVGLNSAFGWTNDRGRLTKEQLEMAKEIFTKSQADIRILVTHHHFVCPPDVHQGSLSESLLDQFSSWGVELVLTGHTHLAHIERRSDGLVLLQSGTATASRWKKLKKKVNSFNLITVTQEEIGIQVRQYDSELQTYAPNAEYTFARNMRQPDNSAIMD
jgi:3',5'-cyclic AMP phosphodiesterase CpdA